MIAALRGPCARVADRGKREVRGVRELRGTDRMRGKRGVRGKRRMRGVRVVPVVRRVGRVRVVRELRHAAGFVVGRERSDHSTPGLITPRRPHGVFRRALA